MTFSITDQGIGISPEDQKVLFQPFGRLARTREMAHGTGLGLFIVKKIIEAHGGSVNVRSTVGEGTTIGFTLPVV
jgi:signal transduction histidine kinase